MFVCVVFFDVLGLVFRCVWFGWVICVLIVFVVFFVVVQYQGLFMLYVLLFGIVLYCYNFEDCMVVGVEFCSCILLCLGVGLLGVCIIWDQVVGLGWLMVLIVLVVVVSMLLCGWWGVKVLCLFWVVGVLVGGVMVICGVLVVLVIGVVFFFVFKGEIFNERYVFFVVVMVILLFMVVMVVYLMVVCQLNFLLVVVGFFIGGSIYDVVQVVVVGYFFLFVVGDVVFMVKLLCVSLFVVVVLGVLVVFCVLVEQFDCFL